jgi:hypothetical protein
MKRRKIMVKKIIIGILVITVLGATGAALAYQGSLPADQVASVTPEPLAGANTSIAGQQFQGNVQTQSDAPVASAQGSLGEEWQAAGTILGLDDNGFDLALENGQTVYVELGPPTYWQAQGVDLYPGLAVSVIGRIMDEMIHASYIELEDGQVLEIRSDTGQPLWSGGASNDRGNGRPDNAGQGTGEAIPQVQAQVDEWITLDGTLISFQGANMTLATPTGELVAIQAGQPRFFASQGITLQVGDELSVLGFYEGENFNAGEVTQLATGMTVMLRDPNGRPLWAGPGNGNGKGGSNH